MAKKKPKQQDIDWTKPPKVEEKGQLAKILARRTRLWRWLIIMCLIVGAVNINLYMNQPETPEIPTPDFNPSGKQVAYGMVEQWLAANPLDAPAHIVSWDGMQENPTEKGTSSTPQVKEYQHSFTVVSNADRWYLVKQTVTSDNKRLGNPSVDVIAAPLLSDTSPAQSWRGEMGEVEHSDALDNAVNQWGAALAGSDSSKLTVLVADPNTKHVYQPLMLADNATTTLDRITYAPLGDINKEDQTSNWAWGSVTVTIPASDNQQERSFTYDVLIKNPTGQGRVVAWGAPGSAPKLKAYQNFWPAEQALDPNVVNSHSQEVLNKNTGE